MTGKPGASGGSREGAGRPLKSYKGTQYTGETPIEKLWVRIAEKYGEEEAEELHLYFNEQKRLYEKRRSEKKLKERDEEPIRYHRGKLVKREGDQQ